MVKNNILLPRLKLNDRLYLEKRSVKFPATGRKNIDTTLIIPVIIPANTALAPKLIAYPLINGVTNITENIKKKDAAMTRITSLV